MSTAKQREIFGQHPYWKYLYLVLGVVFVAEGIHSITNPVIDADPQRSAVQFLGSILIYSVPIIAIFTASLLSKVDQTKRVFFNIIMFLTIILLMGLGGALYFASDSFAPFVPPHLEMGSGFQNLGIGLFGLYFLAYAFLSFFFPEVFVKRETKTMD